MASKVWNVLPAQPGTVVALPDGAEGTVDVAGAGGKGKARCYDGKLVAAPPRQHLVFIQHSTNAKPADIESYRRLTHGGAIEERPAVIPLKAKMSSM